MKSNWRYLFKPEILFLIGAIQANMPYIFWFFGYEMSAYRFTVSYVPLYLWILGYATFWLGAKSVPIFLLGKQIMSKNETRFVIEPGLWRFYLISVIFLCGIQVVFAIRLYGILPIVGFFSGYFDVTTLNLLQQESGFGQLGLLVLTTFTLNALILIGIISDMRWNRLDRNLLYVALGVVVFSTLFSGKIQRFFIFIFVLLSGSSLIKGHPFNPILERFGFRKISRRQTYFVIVVLFIFLILLHGFTRSVRVGSYKEFGIMSAIDAVMLYLSWPHMNMNEQVKISGWTGFQFDVRGVLIGLLPYKLMDKLSEQIIAPLPLLEPSASSGFLGDLHWYLGLWGMLAFCFFIGGLCKFFYVSSRKSIFSLLMYTQIVWTLIASHTYNHFLNLIFIPLPAIVFFLLSKMLRPRIINEKSIFK